MGGANYSSDQASSAIIAQEQESQLDSRLTIGLSLYYSIYEEEELDVTQNITLGDQVREQGKGYMNYHGNEVYEGTPVTEDMADIAYRFVDCSGCEFNLDTCKVEDYHMMKKNLDSGLNSVYQLCLDYEDNIHTYDLHVNIGGYDLIEDLVGITKYILTGSEPKNGISDKKLKSHAKKNFKDKFQQLKSNGWRFKVTYTCLYSAFETFGDGKEAERQKALKNERDHLMFVAITTEKGAAGTRSNKAMRDSNGSISVESASTATHLLLGVGSLCIFFPPFAFACLALDLSIHAVECACAFMVNDKRAAVEHCKGAMLDIVFIIPFHRIGKVLKVGKAGILKAEEKIAAHNLKVAEKGREEGTSALERVKQNNADVSKYQAEVKEGKAQVEADRENYLNEHPNESKDEVENEVIFSSEFKLAESEANYAKAVERSQKENPKLLAKANKYKSEKYNVEAKEEAAGKAKENYTNYVEYGIEVEAKNVSKLGVLLKDIKNKWNTDEFSEIREAIKAMHENGTGTVVTLKGIEENAINLIQHKDRMVASSADFTFIEIVQESAKSIGDDIKRDVVNLGNSAEHNAGFNRML